jgi:Fe-S-cluster containining protein
MEARQSPIGMPSSAPFRVLNGMVYFNGKCEESRPFCAAVCCRGYGFVSLTDEEATSGRYEYKNASETCGCEKCVRMRDLGIRYALPKLSDGSCFYLDGNRQCSIYENRPKTCRTYSCVSIPFKLSPG